MLKVGLTGGIGSGKTTAANFFEELGAKVIDSDQIARSLINPSEPLYNAVIERYGKGILTPDNTINRRALRPIIFADPNEKRWLEDLMHPLIKQKIVEEMENSNAPYCIIVIPLLVEAGTYELVDRILVIDTTVEQQVYRTAMRDNSSEQEVINIIKNQATREERMAIATDVIVNDGDFEDLKQKVIRQHQRYMQTSSRGNS